MGTGVEVVVVWEAERAAAAEAVGAGSDGEEAAGRVGAVSVAEEAAAWVQMEAEMVTVVAVAAVTVAVTVVMAAAAEAEVGRVVDSLLPNVPTHIARQQQPVQQL